MGGCGCGGYEAVFEDVRRRDGVVRCSWVVVCVCGNKEGEMVSVYF